ncbi:unnamed protein product [Ostreobium quekettii]|uniref:Uncharacterized protein n=1 Tax=Ostreobium quekettii TaxID=121088 RepID=A0A8S1J6Y0_9CHLO|nr:unnamed protein product [Ostreobium quekettii]
MLPGAAALDSGRVFEFVGDVATRPDALASLHIYDLDSPEAMGPQSFIEFSFLRYADALWKGGNIPYTNYLQRPSTTIIPNNTEQLADAFSMDVRHGTEKGCFEFANQHPHPYLRARIEHDQVTVERRVYSESTPHGCFPTRVIDVTELSDGSGYTEIMDLKLEPLQDESPVAQEFTAESFRNFEMTYQVYRDHGDGQELAERIYMDYVSPAAAEMETLQPAAEPNNPRIWFLWANGILIFVVMIKANPVTGKQPAVIDDVRVRAESDWLSLNHYDVSDTAIDLHLEIHGARLSERGALSNPLEVEIEYDDGHVERHPAILYVHL